MNQKRFLLLLPSVMVGVLAVVGLVSASTTISTSVMTGGGVYATSSMEVDGQVVLTNPAINSVLATNASGVVIATSTPTFGNFYATSTVATSTISTGGLTVGVSQFIVQQNSGKVGIATTSPASALSVNGNVYFSGTAYIGGLITSTSSSPNSLLWADSSSIIRATSTPTFGNFSATSTVATSTISTGGLTVGTTQFMVQQNSGNVGISTSTPTNALDVNGNAYVSGTSFFGGAITATSSLTLSSAATTTIKALSSIATKGFCLQFNATSTNTVLNMTFAATTTAAARDASAAGVVPYIVYGACNP